MAVHYTQHSSQSTQRHPEAAGAPRLILLAIQGKIELIPDLQKAGTLRFKIFSTRPNIRIFSHVPDRGLIVREKLGFKRIFNRWAEPFKKITVNDTRHIVYNALQKTLLSDPALR